MNKNKKIFIAADHAGYELKEKLKRALTQNPQYSVVDFGTQNTDSVDYPDYADLVCRSIETEPEAYGVLICGSGQGMSIRANKYSYIRAALVYSEETAKLSREHNNANVICLGSRLCTFDQADLWLNIFLETNFAGGRHQARVAKLACSTS